MSCTLEISLDGQWHHFQADSNCMVSDLLIAFGEKHAREILGFKVGHNRGVVLHEDLQVSQIGEQALIAMAAKKQITDTLLTMHVLKIVATAFVLGGIFVGALWLGTTRFYQLGWYMALLCVFHFLEFYMSAMFHAQSVSWDSFLINHSKQFNLALIASVLEYGIRQWLQTRFQVFMFVSSSFISILGLIIALTGQILRTFAMFNAGASFTHKVTTQLGEKQVFVKHGVYTLMRHPAYCGWFYWSISTQLIMNNPICLLLYVYASWKFFKSRIVYDCILFFMVIKLGRRIFSKILWALLFGVPKASCVWNSIYLVWLKNCCE